MPPKKGGKKEEDAPSGDDKATQLLLLQNRLEDTQNKLNAELIVIDQLRGINAMQAKQLAEAESVLKSETEKHAAELWLLYDEANAQKEEAAHQVQVLEEQVKQLQGDNSGLRVHEAETERLRDRIGDMMAASEKGAKAHADETHRLKKEVFSLRMQLEQTFRKSMQELDAEYKERAFASLDDESKNALAANAKLQAELHMQSEGIETLMARYRKMEGEYTKLKIEYEVLAAEQSLQQSRIGGLKRAHMVSAGQLDELQGGQLEGYRKQVKDLRAMLDKESRARLDAQAESKTWEARAKFYEAKQEEEARRKKEARRERDRVMRESRASRASRASGRTPGPEGDDGSDAGAMSVLRGAGNTPAPGAVPAEASVEVFDAYADILAIWNSNFPSKRLAAKSRQRDGHLTRSLKQAQSHAQRAGSALSPALMSTSASQLGFEPHSGPAPGQVSAALTGSMGRRSRRRDKHGALSPLPAGGAESAPPIPDSSAMWNSRVSSGGTAGAGGDGGADVSRSGARSADPRGGRFGSAEEGGRRR